MSEPSLNPIPTPKKPSPSPAPLATSTHGKRNHDNGAMEYRTGGMILGSRLLRAWWGRENPNTVPPQDPEDMAAPRQV